MRIKNVLPHFHVRSVFHNLCYCTHNHMLLNRTVSNNSGSNYDIVDDDVYVLHFTPFSARECENQQAVVVIIFKICIWEMILGSK